MTEKQSEAVARIALELPEQVTNRDVLAALVKAYRAGWHDAVSQSAADLGKAIAADLREHR